MLWSKSKRGVCALVAALAVLLVFAWTAVRVHYVNGGNWSVVFCIGSEFPMPPELDAGTYRVPGPGYDGQFYRLLAHDPFLGRKYARYVDAPQLRFRRLLVPLAAWLLALGQQHWIDRAYIAVEMIFLALGTYWSARLLVRRGRSPLWGLLFVVVPGTLASFDRMLLDGPLTALFAGFMLYCEEERWNRVWVLAMLAALTRENGVLHPAALVAACCFHRDWRGAIRFAASGIPAFAWFGYLAVRLPANGQVNQLAIPVWGMFERLRTFRTFRDPNVQLLVRVTDFLALLGLIACMVLAVYWLRKLRFEPVPICVGLYVCLAVVLCSPEYLIEAFGFGRPISPLLLWIMIEAVDRKTWSALVPPLSISFSLSLAFARPLITIVTALLGH
jgi:hypothetical protein